MLQKPRVYILNSLFNQWVALGGEDARNEWGLPGDVCRVVHLSDRDLERRIFGIVLDILPQSRCTSRLYFSSHLPVTCNSMQRFPLQDKSEACNSILSGNRQG